jgi:hypothetical protein
MAVISKKMPAKYVVMANQRKSTALTNRFVALRSKIMFKLARMKPAVRPIR